MKKIIGHVKKNWQGYAIVLILLIVLFGAPTSHLSVNKLTSSYYGDSVNFAATESRIGSSSYYYGSGNDALDQEARQYIRNANLGLESSSYEASATSVRNAITARNGIILSDNEGTNYNKLKYMNIRAKVDANQLDSLMEELKQFGEVTSLNIYGNDVTGSYTDYTERVARYEAQITKYLAMLERDLSVEEEIDVQSRIDSLEDQLFYYRNRVGNIEEDVAYSDVHVTLTQEPSVLQEVDFLGFKDGFKMFLEALENAVKFILNILGFILPFAVVYGVYRLARRNKKSKKK